jgi:hypothetical protein
MSYAVPQAAVAHLIQTFHCGPCEDFSGDAAFEFDIDGQLMQIVANIPTARYLIDLMIPPFRHLATSVTTRRGSVCSALAPAFFRTRSQVGRQTWVLKAVLCVDSFNKCGQF